MTAGKGDYVQTAYAKQGDMGSHLPKMQSGAVWQAGSVVEALWSVRANHGGGWQFRLCPFGSVLTEDCFQQTFVLSFSFSISISLSCPTVRAGQFNNLIDLAQLSYCPTLRAGQFNNLIDLAHLSYCSCWTVQQPDRCTMC